MHGPLNVKCITTVSFYSVDMHHSTLRSNATTLTPLPPINACGGNTVLLEAQISITFHWSLFVRCIHTEHNESCRA